MRGDDGTEVGVAYGLRKSVWTERQGPLQLLAPLHASHPEQRERLYGLLQCSVGFVRDTLWGLGG